MKAVQRRLLWWCWRCKRMLWARGWKKARASAWTNCCTLEGPSGSSWLPSPTTENLQGSFCFLPTCIPLYRRHHQKIRNIFAHVGDRSGTSPRLSNQVPSIQTFNSNRFSTTFFGLFHFWLSDSKFQKKPTESGWGLDCSRVAAGVSINPVTQSNGDSPPIAAIVTRSDWCKWLAEITNTGAGVIKNWELSERGSTKQNPRCCYRTAAEIQGGEQHSVERRQRVFSASTP